MSTSVRVTEKTYGQLDKLRNEYGYGSLTNALSVAVDRLYRAERPKGATMQEATHKSGTGTVVLKEGDMGYIVTVRKEGLPPHYSQEHATLAEAEAEFERLTEAKPMQIKVTYTAGSLDTTGALTDEHIASYADSLKDWLGQDFPDADIAVAQGDDDDIRVRADGYNETMETQANVHHAMENHYEDWIEAIAAQL